MTRIILIETVPDQFTYTGETFSGDMARVDADLADLQASTGNRLAAHIQP